MDSARRRFLVLGVVLVLLGGVVSLGVGSPVGAQETPRPDPDEGSDIPFYVAPDGDPSDKQAMGESVFGEGATGELLAAGLLPTAPLPATFGLQRVTMVPGSQIRSPEGDPRVVLLYVERGTLTVTNTVAASVTRGSALATPGAELREEIPAGTAYTMRAGDSYLSPPGSGG